MDKKELQFPVVYDLRVIYKGDSGNGIRKVSQLLKDLTISHTDGILKPGGKSELCRLGFTVTLLNKSQMDSMYSNLKTIPEIKWAT